MKTENKPGSAYKLITLAMIPALFLILVSFTSIRLASHKGVVSAEIVAWQSAATTQQDPPYTDVDELPVYHGGDEALLKFIAENAKYPEEAKKNNITGKVIVKFVVEKNCSVSDVTVLKSVNPLLDAEAVRVAGLLKFEKPAVLKGKVVRVFYMVPITFALK